MRLSKQEFLTAIIALSADLLVAKVTSTSRSSIVFEKNAIGKSHIESFGQRSNQITSIVGNVNTDYSKYVKPKSFSERTTRLSFVQKVYGIFSLQVLATILLTGSLFRFPPLLHYFYRHAKIIGPISALVSFVTNLTLVGSTKLRQSFPSNIVLLAISTLAQAIPVGVFSTFFDPLTVCLGSMHTLTIFVALSLYAWQPNPRWDLTMHGQWLLGALASLVLGVPLMHFLGLPLKDNIVASALAMIFAGYIVYDTQLIVNGTRSDSAPATAGIESSRSRKTKLTPDDYILAALLLYQDIMGLFVEILKILGYLKQKNGREDRRNQL